VDGLDRWREIVEDAICKHARVPYAYGDVDLQTVFDRDRDRYIWMNVGWEGFERVLEVVVYIDIREEKVWIQCDGTQHGIAKDLITAGIPKESIVLAFRHPDLREYTEYAVA
jgi:hypothetical protein